MKSVAAFVLAFACVFSTPYRTSADTVGSLDAIYDTFRQIAGKIGIFPGNDDIGARLVIYSPVYDSCVAIQEMGLTANGRGHHGRTVIVTECAWSNEIRTQHFRLKHQDESKLSLLTKNGDCIGFGSDQNMFGDTYTADWCDKSTHQFQLEVNDWGVGFRQIFDRRTCMKAFYFNVFHEGCDDTGSTDFLLCSIDGASCWPMDRFQAVQYRKSSGNDTELMKQASLTKSLFKKAMKVKQ